MYVCLLTRADSSELKSVQASKLSVDATSHVAGTLTANRQFMNERTKAYAPTARKEATLLPDSACPCDKELMAPEIGSLLRNSVQRRWARPNM
jgi:hypothetical protein